MIRVKVVDKEPRNVRVLDMLKVWFDGNATRCSSWCGRNSGSMDGRNGRKYKKNKRLIRLTLRIDNDERAVMIVAHFPTSGLSYLLARIRRLFTDLHGIIAIVSYILFSQHLYMVARTDGVKWGAII